MEVQVRISLEEASEKKKSHALCSCTCLIIRSSAAKLGSSGAILFQAFHKNICGYVSGTPKKLMSECLNMC